MKMYFHKFMDIYSSKCTKSESTSIAENVPCDLVNNV